MSRCSSRGQREQQVLLRGAHLLHVPVAAVGQPAQHVLHEDLRHRRTRGDADARHAVQPRLVDLGGPVDPVRGGRAVLEGDLHQPHRVRRVRRAHDDDQVGLRRDLLHRHLAVLRGVADVVARRVLQRREPLAQPAHRLHRLVDAERGLGEPDHLVGVAHRHRVDRVRAVDELHVVGRLARRALDLLVARVADQQDVVVGGGEPDGLLVHLGDQRAGGVDRLQLPRRRLGVHRGRDPVRREDHQLALGHVVGLVDEHRAALLQRRHHVLVVDDLLAHVDRRPVVLQRLLDGDHRAVDAGAVAAGRCEQDLLGGFGHPSIVRSRG